MISDEARKTVTYGIIASILFVVFIQPLLKLTWQGLNWFGATVYSGFIDNMYQSAAMGKRDLPSMLLLLFVFGGSTGFFSGFLTGLRSKALRREMPVPVDVSKRLKMTIQILSPLMLLALLILTTECFADFQLNTTFSQQLDVLSPHITDQQYKELRSRWASMKRRDDYISLTKTIEELARQSGAELPKNHF